MSQSIQCVHCDAALRLGDDPAGKRVRCPKCERSFTMGDEPAPARRLVAAVTSSAPPPTGKRHYEEEVDDDALPARLKKKKHKRGPYGVLVLIALLGGVAVLSLMVCAGCGVSGYFLFFAGPR